MEVNIGSDKVFISRGFNEDNSAIEAVGQGIQIIFIRNTNNKNHKDILLYPFPEYKLKIIGDSIETEIREEYLDFFNAYKNPQFKNGKIEIKYIAHCEQTVKYTENIDIKALVKNSIWSETHLKGYCNYDNTFLWILRVYKLRRPIYLSKDKSRIFVTLDKYHKKELENLGRLEAEPVLSDEEFNKMKKTLFEDLKKPHVKIPKINHPIVEPPIMEPEDNELIYVEPEEIDQATPQLKIPLFVYRNIANSIDSGKHIILEGVPGTGKTEIANALCDLCVEKGYVNGYTQATATSDWSTYDTIGGLMPDKDGNLYFSEGIVLKSIRENNLLIIDEINRADIDKAFGPLFTVLSNQTVELNYKIFKDENDKIGKNIKIVPDLDHQRSYFDSEDATYYVGNNWRIIGTMNTYDKDSLYDLSYAFMRRFFFCNVDVPDENAYIEIINSFNELDVEYKSSLKKLIKLNNEEYSRKIGPAVIIDLIKYLITCQKYSSEDNFAMEEAVIGYIIPQFEGLPQKSLEQIESFLIDTVKLDESMIQNKFNDIQETF